LVSSFTRYSMRLHFLLSLLSLAVSFCIQPALAQVVAPSQGGGVSIIRATATTMELNFGTMGTGQGRLLAIAETDRPIPLTIVDGQFYTGNANYGQGSKLDNGYVAYSGTGHSVTVTGLKPSTSYYFINAEYNTDGNTIMYNTHGTSMSTATRSAPLTLVPTPTPLPVELTSFTGTVDASNLATLHWTTASERNSAYFAIERSTDGNTFTEIGRVAAATISNDMLPYQWLDHQHLLRSTYYRLRQVDHDGTAHYSAVIVLAPTSSVARLIEVYPNPSAGQTVQLLLQGYSGESLTLQVTDALGRLVMTQVLVPASAQYLTPLLLPQSLTTGTYILSLNGSSPVQKRIILSN
jgi:hypothetical protein